MSCESEGHAHRSGQPSWSLAARLTLWYAGSAFLLVLGATGFLYWALFSNLDREDDQFLANKVRILRRVLQERPDDPDALKQEVVWVVGDGAAIPFRIRILDSQGSTLLESPGMDWEVPHAAFLTVQAADEEPGPAHEYHSPNGKTFRLVAARATVGQPPGPVRILQVAFDRTHEETLLAGYRRSLLGVLLSSLVLCTLIGHQIARRGLQPLTNMAKTAARIRATNLGERMALAGMPTELSGLASTFNEMLERLQEAFDRLSRFSADIAHELRTPVNNLRGEMEVALHQERSPDEYRQVLASGLEECTRLTRLIDNLLFLARAESPEAQISCEPVDVHHELHTLREYYEAAAAEAGVMLTVCEGPHANAELDRTLFQSALCNLIENALAHTPRGGRVTLSAARDGDQLIIEVADTGQGIAPEHLPHIFDRFFRADPARHGGAGRTGLGLALVQTIVALHHGTVAASSTVGQGTRIILTFPTTRPVSLT